MSKPPLSPFLLNQAHRPAPRSGCAEAPARRGALDLGTAELFVLAVLRAWAAPRLRPAEPHPDWHELFHLAQLPPGAAEGFEAVMAALAMRAVRPVEVHCCRCPALGEDEEAMLRLVAALQADAVAAAQGTLREWLPDEAITPALDAARRFALGLATAGMTLPRRGVVLPFPLRPTLH